MKYPPSLNQLETWNLRSLSAVPFWVIFVHFWQKILKIISTCRTMILFLDLERATLGASSETIPKSFWPFLNFFRAFKVSKSCWKSAKFRHNFEISSRFFQKIEKFYFSKLWKRSTRRMITEGSALESPDLGQHFKHLKRMFTTHGKFFTGSWS